LDTVAAGLSPPLWSVLPFAGLLLSIAVAPLVASDLWARHFGKVSAAFGLPVAAWFLVAAPRELLHTSMDYVSFVILLASLFTISGGILVRGGFKGRPLSNAAFLAVGAVAANVLGTTGASMLLVRPLLRANAGRRRAAHVFVFFIFVVSNLGGLLTPIGDPPLFLGYLKGVPFFWTVRNLWPLWLLATGIVILAFLAADALALRAEARGNPGTSAPAPAGPRAAGESVSRFGIDGKENFLYLATVIGAVFLPAPWREIVMVAAAAASVRRTPAPIRAGNGFTWHPILEVAILFAGIFATMMPALLILRARGGELGVTSPAEFFWASGGLSSFLDNAPTYLTFFSLAQGLGGPSPVAGVSAPILKAISAGSVFMGANTYIGNAPNFMVKAVAESAGVKMPSFFEYTAYSVFVLLPVFALVTWVFL
jgi:Na+/H+ antiporter NhaD/arsenite permease-like protein